MGANYLLSLAVLPAQEEPERQPLRSSKDERLHALNVLAALGFVLFAVYPLIDQLLKRVTGDKDVRIRF